MAYYLQMDGVNDYIITPSLTFTEVLIDFTPHQATKNQYYVDMRDATYTSPYLLHTSTNDQWAGCTVYVDEVQKTTGSIQIPNNIRHVLRIVPSGAPVTRTVNFCRRWTGVEFLSADFYTITFKNGASTIAQYDMTTQTVQDQSGNGNHATLTGGTWVDDGIGGTPTAHDGISSLAGIGILSATGTRLVDGATFLSGFGTAVGISDTLSMFDGIASLTGNGSLSGQGTVLASGVSFLTGNSQFIGTGNLVSIPVTHNGSSSLIGKGQLIGIGVEIIDPNADIVDTIELEGIHNLIVYLDGVRLLTIILEGGLKLKTGQNFFIMSGNSKNIEVTIKDKEGNAVDLTGATVKWLVHSSGTQRVYKDTANGILITDAENGEILISLLSSDTSSLSGEYSHELKIIDSDGKASTVAVGKMNVTKSYLQ